MDTATDGHHVLQWGESDSWMRYWCWRPGPLQSWRNHGLPCRIWPFPGKDLLGKPDSQTDSLRRQRILGRSLVTRLLSDLTGTVEEKKGREEVQPQRTKISSCKHGKDAAMSAA